MTKTEENLFEARRLRSLEIPITRIAELMGISFTTARQWTDPGYYEKHMARSKTWNNDKRKSRAGIRKTDAEKEAHRKEQRARYVNSKWFKHKLYRFRRNHGANAQEDFRSKVRLMILGHAGRTSPMNTAMVTAVTGVSLEQFTEAFQDGILDFVVPLTAFDLTRPEEMVRAMYRTNIYIRTEEPVERTWTQEEIDAMPWIGDDDAYFQAAAVISRMLSRYRTKKAERYRERFDNPSRRREVKVTAVLAPVGAEAGDTGIGSGEDFAASG